MSYNISMKKIPLTQGKYALVDNEDYLELSKYKWQYNKGYAKRGVFNGTNMSDVFMHRVINNTPDGMDTDHINRDRLDNRKENLRSCTRKVNSYNAGHQKNNRLGVKGVHMRGKRFRAVIGDNYKRIHLGYFDTIEEASNAYMQALKQRGGVPSV